MDITFLRADMKFQVGAAAMSVPHFHAMPEQRDREKHTEHVDDVPRRVNFESARHLLSAGAEVFTETGGGSFAEATPELRTRLRNCVKKVFTTGRALREKVTFATNYGHTIAGEYFFWPELDAEGKVAAVMTQFWDLTDSILAERRARLNEMRLEALYRLTQMDGVPESDVMAFVMESLVRLTESANGFLFFPAAHSRRNGRVIWSKNLSALADAGLLDGRSLPEEFFDITLTEDGTHRPKICNGNCLQPVLTAFGGNITMMRYIAAPVFEGERLVCIAAAYNKENAEYERSDLQQLQAFINSAWLVLRRHEYIRALQYAKESAEKAVRVKDEFMANVSHELRTPLNGVLSMLQLLESLPLSSEHRDYLHTAQSSGKALLRIISDILDFARIESGKMKLQIEPFDFITAFESSLSLFRTRAAEQGLTFKADIDAAIPRHLLGDDARVRQILFNIVGNAIKFTEQGGIHVTCSLLPRGKKDEVRVYLAVSDTGIGISHEDQARIFEAFTQIDSSSTRKYKGTGLGLSIVRHLVELMGGSVSLESEEGVGTTIHCSLCFTKLPEADSAAEPDTAACEDATANPLQILVSEDDDVSRFAIRKFMEKLGYTPVCVPNGRLALEVLQLHPFHCLLTDIQMPDMDGLELLRRIRENHVADIAPTDEAKRLLSEVFPGPHEVRLPVPADILAVTVSAHTMKGDRERFLEAGMDFYLSKPVMLKELQHVLEQVAARVAARHPHA